MQTKTDTSAQTMSKFELKSRFLYLRMLERFFSHGIHGPTIKFSQVAVRILSPSCFIKNTLFTSYLMTFPLYLILRFMFCTGAGGVKDAKSMISDWYSVSDDSNGVV